MGRSEKSLSGSHDDAVVQVPSGATEQPTPAWTPEEEKKVLRKVDYFLIPTVWVMSLLAWMDRAK